jgi:hypothetical protein
MHTVFLSSQRAAAAVSAEILEHSLPLSAWPTVPMVQSARRAATETPKPIEELQNHPKAA